MFRKTEHIGNLNLESCLVQICGIFIHNHLLLCVACNCDSIGSIDEDCNESSGQCKCIDNVTGRSCNQCEAGYWGLHTQNQCVECSCCINGTVTSQCDDVSVH